MGIRRTFYALSNRFVEQAFVTKNCGSSAEQYQARHRSSGHVVIHLCPQYSVLGILPAQLAGIQESHSHNTVSYQSPFEYMHMDMLTINLHHV
jgi:hypothetical protein